ncbi:MAG TPA: glutathione peroxidase [Acholeplasmatales bacterium]|nr:MAG: glutathione peroxidase [Tenericutes bacterium GWF2_57_13]HAQ57284.1 glutathione peroxidase [Acholeplasmatales bacterium]
MSLYTFTVNDAKGNPVSLSAYQGKVLLVVNTATHCGYTPQYAELEELYKRHHDAGLEILDFPCNQFAGQAPEAMPDYIAVCQLKYHTEFLPFEKLHVNGDQEHPLFTFLKDGKKIRWNFTKFLVDRNGTVVKRFEPGDKPLGFESDILALLK